MPYLYMEPWNALRIEAADSFGPQLDGPRGACMLIAQECREAEELFDKCTGNAKDPREALASSWHIGGIPPGVFEAYVTRGLYVPKSSQSSADQDWTL